MGILDINLIIYELIKCETFISGKINGAITFGFLM